MTQQKLDLGYVKGDPGEIGEIASATATADNTHSDEPQVTVDVGGEPGAQTLAFTFTGLQGEQGDQGLQGTQGDEGKPGADAKIISATATADATHSESPTVTVDVGGEAGNQTLAFTFTGLQGEQGAPGDQGEQGKGSSFYVGIEVKRNQDAVEGTVDGAIDGDMYYNTETSDLFKMESEAWVYKATLAQGSGVEFATEEDITAAIGQITWGSK